MSMIEVEIDASRTAFEPGDTVTGSASWDLPGPPSSLDVCLVWIAKGAGATQQDGVAARVPIEGAGSRDTRTFALLAPDGPYSYTGKLLTISWAVELQAEPGGRSARTELVIAPGGHALEPAR